VPIRIKDIRVPKLTSRQEILKKTDAALKKLWQGAIKAFVFATANKVRVQTGMARGSIVPLARVVRLGLAVENTISADARRKKLRNLRYNGPEGGIRSKSRGIQFGEDAYSVSYERGSLQFEFTVTVHEWLVNEKDWRALEAGRTAFNQYIDEFSGDLELQITRAVIESFR
jgi:ribosomal protein L16/L10AE